MSVIEEEILELGDGTYISVAEGARTRVRGGGFGSDAWIARLTGTDPKFGFDRDFLPKQKRLSGSGASGSISWPESLADGIYEWRKFCVGSTSRNWESSGFARVSGVHIEEISKVEAIAALKEVRAA